MKIQFREYTLREYEDNDIYSLSDYANNQKIAANLRDGFPHPYTVEDALRFIEMVRSSHHTYLAIATADEVIGGIGFTTGEDVHRFTAELGYWLAEPFWNRGIVTEAVTKIVQFAFAQHDLVRIFAEPYADNYASMRVLEKAGFEREGILRANVVKGGKLMDQVLYAKINKNHYHFTRTKQH